VTQVLRPTILLVHGAWVRSWCWQTVVAELSRRGWQVLTVDLPTTGSDAANSGLHDDADLVRRTVAGIDGPVVVVGHSYGGAVVSEAVVDVPNVSHLVYVCAFQLDGGESLLGVVGGEPVPWWVVDGDVMTVDDPGRLFFNDVPAEQADRAIALLEPFSCRAVAETLTAAAWHSVPSTYIVCDDDVAVGAGQEIFATRATHVHRLPSGHFPFLSVPSQLTDLIVKAASR
jgi:pimeloyl-ACP methyl ester carboxylesterase